MSNEIPLLLPLAGLRNLNMRVTGKHVRINHEFIPGRRCRFGTDRSPWSRFENDGHAIQWQRHLRLAVLAKNHSPPRWVPLLERQEYAEAAMPWHASLQMSELFHMVDVALDFLSVFSTCSGKGAS